VFALFEGLFAKRHDHVLNQRGGGVENPAVVGRNHQQYHQQHEQPHHPHRKLFAQQHRHHHLVVEGAELLERRVVLPPDVPGLGAFRVDPGGGDPRLRRPVHGMFGRIQIALIRVVRLRIGLIDADDMPDRRNGGRLEDDILPDFGVGDGLFRDSVNQGDPHVPGPVGEMPGLHHRNQEQRQQRQHQRGEPVAPRPQNPCHLLLVRRPARAGGVVADPGAAVQHRTDDGDDEGEQIEVTERGDVHRVEEALSLDAVEHDRSDIVVPRNFAQHKHRENHEDGVGHQPLDGVGDQKRNASAGPDDQHGQRQDHDHHQSECGDLPAPEIDRQRKPHEVNEEPCRHRRPDRIGHDLRDGADERRHNSQRPVVAHLQELPHRQGPGLAVPVEHVTGERHEDAQRHNQLPPETDRQSALVFLLAE